MAWRNLKKKKRGGGDDDKYDILSIISPHPKSLGTKWIFMTL